MTTYRHYDASRGAGFTLVEILVVIAIIGMLAGLTTTVLVSARSSVRNSVVTSTEAQLSMALDEYKNRYGEYPPDLSDDIAVMRHIKKRWPRYNVASAGDFMEHIKRGCQISSAVYANRNDAYTASTTEPGQHVWVLGRYVSSLVFWLGGLPDANGIPSGFYANPKCPLGVDRDGNVIAKPARATREKPLFEFDRKNLAYLGYDGSGNDTVFYPGNEDSLWDAGLGAYVYTPAYCQGDLPIVYFRPSLQMPYIQKYIFWGETASDGVTCARPYARFLDGVKSDWYEERRFQLIHPGIDGYFGPVDAAAANSSTQPRVNCFPEDDDNIVNFVSEGTLQREYQD